MSQQPPPQQPYTGGQPGIPQQAPQPPHMYPPQPQPGQTHPLATAALICGLAGLCFWPAEIAAIILGILGMNKIRESRGFYAGYGMAKAGMIIGIVYFALLILLGILYVLFVIGIIAFGAASGAGYTY